MDKDDYIEWAEILRDDWMSIIFLSKYTLKNKQMNLSNQNSNLISIYFVSFWYQSFKCYFDVILL